MGELSNKIGEEGEAIALSFFKSIGWSPLQTAIDIDCCQPEDHKRKGAKKNRSKHGLDLLFSYLCPLVPRVRRNILISMKNSDYEKTQTKTSLIKNDLKDLNTLLDCFSLSPERATLLEQGGQDKVHDCGILIRINRDSNVDRSNLVDSASSSLLLQNAGNHLCFVENDRFDFVDSCMSYMNMNFRDLNNFFNIHRNPLNTGGEVRLFESKILPFQSLVGGPIIMRSEDSQSKKLIVFSNESFTQTSLKRLIGLALQCSDGWASEIRFVVNGYDRTKSSVTDSLRAQVESKSIADTMTFDSFEIKTRLK